MSEKQIQQNHSLSSGDGQAPSQVLASYKKKGRIARQASQWLTLRIFQTPENCLAALNEGGWTIWATDLAKGSIPLVPGSLVVPSKVAIVMGRESSGVSATMLAAADRHVHLPTYGFTGCLNVSVAAALVMQQLFFMCPEARGQMEPEEREKLRKQWSTAMASGDEVEREC